MRPPVTVPAVVLSRLRNWMAERAHSPYQGVLHDVETDKQIDWCKVVREILWSLPEGARVSIDVTYELPEQGDIDPTDYWELLKPHTYGHHSLKSKETK